VAIVLFPLNYIDFAIKVATNDSYSYYYGATNATKETLYILKKNIRTEFSGKSAEQ